MSQHTNSTVIIDTGCANLSSVRYAFERLTKDVVVSEDHQVIKAATRVVLPGVGTAGAAMASLNNKQLVELIQSLDQPVLGVCLGMQMMTEKSTEQGGRDASDKAVDEKTACECLRLIPTSITDLDSQGLPLPHMGWNQISPSSHPLFKDIPEGSYLYFVHNYKAPLSEFTIATCEYGERFSAAIAKDNFMGVQFHPEKSAEVGSRILSNFLAMNTQTLYQTPNQTSWQLDKESRA
ncbi:imidazole glycerol phosphate synthase subunit HisH [Shewanella psychropiezotolerans]|uniref:Imidazole glycerol phosphate synthase subunit HisH n=1 Tax=Shewanella psychropiezotolerans TaxID=2593655 RepID=A0ABX5WZE6_9GAMM|nr:MULTISPECIES: imidazole glycerol phosphate synthase subunit HisH [Shewanella]MPY24261.1 imidazole glycerol phosphate synthase subunit HisH [Shewanella sp. YLB-07]QDO84464.1 imidazole glycerol phosphate synthase subunit HisH [Shewanella psychropiezotolerans]